MAITDTLINDPMPDVTRLEILDERGRAYVRHDLTISQYMVQDDGKTLKIVVSPNQSDQGTKL